MPCPFDVASIRCAPHPTHTGRFQELFLYVSSAHRDRVLDRTCMYPRTNTHGTDTRTHMQTFTCMHPSVCTHQDVAEFHAQLLELLSVAFAMSSARTKSTPDPSPKPPKPPKVSKQMSEELIALTTELQVMVLLLTVDQRVFVGPELSTNQPACADCAGRNRTGRRRGDWAVARQDSGSGGNRGRGG